MESGSMESGPDATARRRGRRVFFSWFFALFGLGAALLVLLLLGTGSVSLTSPIILALLVLSAVGVVCLVVAVIGLFRARSRTAGGASRG